MDTVHFANEALPIFLSTECITDHKAHSEMAHWHDHIEIIVIGHGSISCHAGGTNFFMSKGDVCFINRRQLHRLESVGGEECCCHKVLIIGTSLFAHNPVLYEKYIRPVLEDDRFSHIRFDGSGSPAARIADLVEHTDKIIAGKAPGYELDLIATAHLIFHQLYMAYISAPKPHPHDINAQIQQQMAEYIYDHYADQLSLDDIAASGGVSRSQCSRLFKQYTDLSPISFLNKHRLELSREMLRGSADSVSTIAQNIGFSDQSYFNKLFVREYGVTPTAYRKSAPLQAVHSSPLIRPSS